MQFVIKVFKYYTFKAKDITEALQKIDDDSAFDEMIPDDESDVLEVFYYDETNDDKSTIWRNSNKPTIIEFIDKEIKTFHDTRSLLQHRSTNNKDIGFLRCLEYIKSNIEKGNIDLPE